VATLTWRALLAEATAKVGAVDARWIVAEASGYEGAELALHLDEPCTRRAVAHADDMLARRQAGEPLQYVLGHWAFRTLDLMVDRRVLIPRPETEWVVEIALGEARAIAATLLAGEPLLVADLGTGSGAIALSMAVEAGAEVWATDVSDEALEVARANVAGTGGPAATRVRLLQGDWFAALPEELAGLLHVVVSNPPYVGAAEVLPPEVSGWEPPGALVAGPTGLEAIEVIVAEAPRWLAPAGVLVVEVAPHHAAAVVGLARAAGFASAEVHPDLAGRPRALVARMLPAA
jgi:release factor glutamine methyltransferase